MLRLAEEFSADEIMILTITGDYATRRRSYELIAQAFDLKASVTGAGERAPLAA
jgi:hypothetical protein